VQERALPMLHFHVEQFCVILKLGAMLAWTHLTFLINKVYGSLKSFMNDIERSHSNRRHFSILLMFSGCERQRV